jgi:hypothetical protein
VRQLSIGHGLQPPQDGAAEKEAAERRATDAQVLEDAERLIAMPGMSARPSANADAVLADDRRCHRRALIVWR